MKLDTNQIKNYWTTRSIRAFEAQENNLTDQMKIVRSAYIDCGERMSTELNSFYQKYAKDNKIDLADAQKMLNTKSDMTPDEAHTAQQVAYAQALAKYKAAQAQGGNVEAALKQLKAASSKANVTRLQSLMSKINSHLTETTANVENTIGQTLQDSYDAQTLINAYTLKETTGISVDFGTVGGDGLSKVSKMKWLGGDYSNRIWDNKAKLMQTLESLIPQEFVRGRGSSDLARLIQEKMNTSYSNANRLARTELNFVSNQASRDFYAKLSDVSEEFNKYEYLATLDNRTSEICGELDGQVFEHSKAEVGVNFPPMHPYCRSTTIPYFSDENLYGTSPRIARDLKTGKSYLMTDKLDFKEWVEVNAESYVPLYKSKPKLFKNIQPQPPKPPIDSSAWTGTQLFNLTYNKGDEFQKTLNELGIADREGKEILEAYVNRKMSPGTSREALFQDYRTLDLAVKVKVLDVDDVVEYGFDKYGYKDTKTAFKLDMIMDGLTQKQAYNRLWTGHAVDDWDEYLKDNEARFKKDPTQLDKLRDDVIRKYRLYYKSPLTSAYALPSFKGDNTADRMDVDEIFKQMDKVIAPLYKGYDGNKTWPEIFSSKKFEGTLLQENMFYVDNMKKYLPELTGVSTEYIVKYMKGKYPTLASAKKAYQDKEQEYKAKAAEKAMANIANTYPPLDMDMFDDEGELWDDFGDRRELENLIRDTKLPNDGDLADSRYRPWASVFWKASTPGMRKAAYDYTAGSGKFNRPLEGYQDSWGPSYYKPQKSLESLMTDTTINHMFDLYDAVKMSQIPESIRVVRGGDIDELFGTSGMFKSLGLQGMHDINKAVGSTVTVNRFLSTGVAKGKGFGGDIQYEIILPKGTQALYVEPFSAYGGSNKGMNWDGKPSYSGTIGGEQEIIVQAGTQFIVHSIDKGMYTTKITMVAIPKSQQTLPDKLATTALGKSRLAKGLAKVRPTVNVAPLVEEEKSEEEQEVSVPFTNVSSSAINVSKTGGISKQFTTYDTTPVDAMEPDLIKFDVDLTFSKMNSIPNLLDAYDKGLIKKTKQMAVDLAYSASGPTTDEFKALHKQMLMDMVGGNKPQLFSHADMFDFEEVELFKLYVGMTDDEVYKQIDNNFMSNLEMHDVDQVKLDDLLLQGTLMNVGAQGYKKVNTTGKYFVDKLAYKKAQTVVAKVDSNKANVMTAAQFKKLHANVVKELDEQDIILSIQNPFKAKLSAINELIKKDSTALGLMMGIDGVVIPGQGPEGFDQIILFKKDNLLVDEKIQIIANKM